MNYDDDLFYEPDELLARFQRLANRLREEETDE